MLGRMPSVKENVEVKFLQLFKRSLLLILFVMELEK